MKTFPTIYKLTNTGAITTWYAEVRKGQFRTHHGHKDGAITTSEWTDAEITNKGRSNQRDPFQQAIFEVEAEYKKKLKRDYHKTEKDAREMGSHIFEPMLAEGFDKVKPKHYPKFPDVFYQPKLDGMRCITNAKGMFSRTGEKVISCPHIWEVLKPLFEAEPDLILDGELYNHDLNDNFDEIMSIFKGDKPTKDDLAKARVWGQYHVYDMPSDENFGTRFAQMKLLFKTFNEEMNKFVKRVKTFRVESVEAIKELYKSFIEAGYEGGIIRADSPYENKRTWALMKDVRMKHGEFKLLSFESGKGNWAGKARKAWLVDSNGRKFKADVVGTYEYCAKILHEQALYIGYDTTVQYKNLTPKGVPRCGKVKELNRKDHK